MVKRKTPIHHKVEKHKRNGRTIQSYIRGSGIEKQRSSRVVGSKKPRSLPRYTFKSIREMEQAIATKKIPTFENVVVRVGGRDYTILVEEWWDDCMESRGLGETSMATVRDYYADIMRDESGLKVHEHGYLPDEIADFGVSYIMERRGIPRRNVSRQESIRIGDIIGVNWKKFSKSQFRKGMNVELEHGVSDPQTNVTGDNLVATGKIALAHIKEFPNYYELLDKMEKKATHGK